MDATMMDVVNSKTANGTMTTPDNPINKSNVSMNKENVRPNVPPNVKYSNGSSIVIFFFFPLAVSFLFVVGVIRLVVVVCLVCCLSHRVTDCKAWRAEGGRFVDIF